MEMLVRSVGLAKRDLVVSVHSTKEPSAGEWEIFLRALKEADDRRHGDMTQVLLLMIGDGGAPDTLMRDALNKQLAGRPVLTAAVTDSLLARGVIVAISWFNPQLRQFAPANGEGVFKHLLVEKAERQQVVELLKGMAAAMPNVASLGALISSLQRAQAASSP